ncbi:hypothetical protein KKI17_00145 [Patescibacteria group bacterium]|nr:hypothetical protein [Patescibacteria group bacterium]
MNAPTIDIEKYGGRQVAIVHGRVVASGGTLKEVIALAKKEMPSIPLREIKVFSVPKSSAMIYYV